MTKKPEKMRNSQPSITEDELDFLKFFVLLYSKRKTLLFASFAGILLAAFFEIFFPHSFVGEVTFRNQTGKAEAAIDQYNLASNAFNLSLRKFGDDVAGGPFPPVRIADEFFTSFSDEWHSGNAITRTLSQPKYSSFTRAEVRALLNSITVKTVGERDISISVKSKNIKFAQSLIEAALLEANKVSHDKLSLRLDNHISIIHNMYKAELSDLELKLDQVKKTSIANHAKDKRLSLDKVEQYQAWLMDFDEKLPLDIYTAYQAAQNSYRELDSKSDEQILNGVPNLSKLKLLWN